MNPLTPKKLVEEITEIIEDYQPKELGIRFCIKMDDGTELFVEPVNVTVERTYEFNPNIQHIEVQCKIVEDE